MYLLLLKCTGNIFFWRAGLIDDLLVKKRKKKEKKKARFLDLIQLRESHIRCTLSGFFCNPFIFSFFIYFYEDF